MKKYFILSILSWLINGPVFAQFSAKTEWLYLEHINAQARKDLIRDNLPGAEMAGLLFINQPGDRWHGPFFNALAHSYQLVSQPEAALYHSLVQRCLYPDDSLARQQELFFNELLYALNLPDSAAASVVARTTASNLPALRTDRMALVLELTTRHGSRNITANIYALGLKLRENNVAPPVWYQHWEFLTQIGMSTRRKKDIITYADTLAVPVYQQGKMADRLKIYRKAIRYYLREHARNHARQLSLAYRQEPLAFGDKVAFALLRLRLSVR